MILKRNKILIFFILSLFATLPVFANNQSIMYVQAAPGEFTTYTFIKFKNQSFVSIRGYGKSAVNIKNALEEKDFENLWFHLTTIEELKGFHFEPKDEDNLADPNFHNITLSSGKEKTYIRIPKENDNPVISQLVSSILSYAEDS